MKHIYLCGPVSGRRREVAALHFNGVEQSIRYLARMGDAHVCTSNPMRFCPPDLGWHQAMRACVGELARCGGVALLQGWQKSTGAKLELKLAGDLHIPVVYIEPPVECVYLSSIFAAAPETLRYYNALLLQLQKKGVDEGLAGGKALAELANRYLDPHGFEYISIGEGE